jgi:hypothetical protein
MKALARITSSRCSITAAPAANPATGCAHRLLFEAISCAGTASAWGCGPGRLHSAWGGRRWRLHSRRGRAAGTAGAAAAAGAVRSLARRSLPWLADGDGMRPQHRLGHCCWAPIPAPDSATRGVCGLLPSVRHSCPTICPAACYTMALCCCGAMLGSHSLLHGAAAGRWTAVMVSADAHSAEVRI